MDVAGVDFEIFRIFRSPWPRRRHFGRAGRRCTRLAAGAGGSSTARGTDEAIAQALYRVRGRRRRSVALRVVASWRPADAAADDVSAPACAGAVVLTYAVRAAMSGGGAAAWQAVEGAGACRV